MQNEYKIHYTEAANEKLEALKDHYVDMLEEIIKQRKYVPGEKMVEITASDLEQASQYLRIIAPRRSESLKLILAAYFIIGVTMTIAGLLYPTLMEMLRESPERLMLAVGGLTLSAFGAFGYFRIKQREAMYRSD